MKVYLLYKVIRRVLLLIKNCFDTILTKVIFWGNNVQCSSFKTVGTPYVSVAMGGTCSIGHDLRMNNGIVGNPIGNYSRCTLFVDKGAKLVIGSNLGISQAALICQTSITIGDNVKIGGGVSIYDTDFHSLNPLLRKDARTDIKSISKLPVVVKDNVFIGAQSTILKGVTIGHNSIIGAGSLVAKNIPSNEIWAGNPAKFIKNVTT